jgi:hypothetical protein
MSDLGDLAQFNDEERADKPYTIELRGGRADGQRLTFPELPSIYRVPEPLGLVEFLTAPDPILSTEPAFRIAGYRRCDEVTDDGVHIYAFNRYE